MPDSLIVLTREEAEQVYRFLANSYIDVNRFGALARLIGRIERALQNDESSRRV